MSATKKDCLDADTSRSSHKATSFLSSLNGQARRRVFGGTHDGEDPTGVECSYPKISSYASKTLSKLPILNLARQSELAHKVESIKERMLSAALTKSEKFRSKLVSL